MEKIILMTPDELKEMMYEVLDDYFKDREFERQKRETPDSMTIDDAIEFLRENGFPTSKATMYRLTSNGAIPYGKYGNRLVFSRKQLIQWVENNTVKMDQASIHEDALESIRRLRRGRRT